VPIDDLVAETAAAECELLVRCHIVSDVDVCQPYFVSLFAPPTFNSFGALAAAARAGKAGYDGAAARACLDEIRHWACTRALPNPFEVCGKAFTGTAAVGDRCIAEC